MKDERFKFKDDVVIFGEEKRKKIIVARATLIAHFARSRNVTRAAAARVFCRQSVIMQIYG